MNPWKYWLRFAWFGATSSGSTRQQRVPVSTGFSAGLPWLLSSLGISMTALIGTDVRFWTLLVFGACAIWRQRIEHTAGRLPSLLVRLALFLPVCAIMVATYGVHGMHANPAALLTFLVPLLSLKVLELRSHRDFIVVAVLGYFMNLSAFFYNQTLAISLYLGLAVATNTIALIRCHDGGRKHALRSSVWLALSLMAQAVPLVVFLFVVFPRVQMDLFQLHGLSKGVTGMSEHLQPGSVESLAESTEPAFRAKIVSGGPVTARNLYWRGLVLGVCESPLSWRAGSQQELPPRRRVAGETRIEQQITMKTQGERWLFALDRPSGVKSSSGLHAALMTGNILRSRAPVVNASMYTAYSDPGLADLDELSAPEKAFYARPPAALSSRVTALVQSWVRSAQAFTGAPRENEIIRQARLFFRDGGFVYTLTPGRMPEEGALDYFLFESRRGFCEHYAAAFSTLMRVAGLPSRVVLGYQGGEYNTWGGGYYLIRQSDAHAWSEVWITGQGWQREDPTAVVAPDRVSFGAENYEALTSDGLTGESRLDRLNSPGMWRWLVRNGSLAWDGLDQQWNLLVLGYDDEKRDNTLQDLGLGNLDWLEGGLLALLAAFGLLALGALGVHAMERKQSAKIEPAVRLYDRFCRKIAQWTGVQRAAAEGPLDFSKRASSALPDQARQIRAITDLYVRSRYALPMHDDLTLRTLEALTAAVDDFREPAKSK